MQRNELMLKFSGRAAGSAWRMRVCSRTICVGQSVPLYRLTQQRWWLPQSSADVATSAMEL